MSSTKTAENDAKVSSRPLTTLLKVTCLLSAVSCLCFARCYNGDFVFDDSEAILKNDDVMKPESTDVLDLFSHDFWGANISTSTSHKSYRPLTIMTFRWNYILAGGLHPMGFHMVNIVLHICVCILLFNVLCKVVPASEQRENENVLLSVPFMATLLFTVHPLHTEAVCGVVGRAELLSTLLVLVALRCYIYDCQTNRTILGLLLSGIFTTISVLCKEQGITALALCSSYDVFIHHKWKLIGQASGSPRKRPRSMLSVVARNLMYSEDLVFRHMFLTILGGMILLLRWYIMGGQLPVFQHVDNPHSFVNSTYLRVLNYQYLYSINAWLCLVPYWLCFDWSMGCVPTIDSILDPRLLAPAVLWAILAMLFLKTFLKPPQQQNQQIIFAVSLVILPFLPASNLLFRVGFVIAERVLYLPSAGVCLLLALFIQKVHATIHNLPTTDDAQTDTTTITDSPKHDSAKNSNRNSRTRNNRHSAIRSAKSGSGAVINRKMLSSYGISNNVNINNSNSSGIQTSSNERNLKSGSKDLGKIDMKSDEISEKSATEEFIERNKEKLSTVLYSCFYIVVVLYIVRCVNRSDEWNSEIKLFESGAEVCPLNAKVHYNIGKVHSDRGNTDSGLQAYRRAIELHPEYDQALNNLGNLLKDLGQLIEAELLLTRAVEINSKFAAAWMNLGIVQASLNKTRPAKESYHNALRHRRKYPDCYYNLGNLYLEVSQHKAALSAWRNATLQNPHHVSAWFNMLNLLDSMGRFQDLEQVAEEGIRLNPNQPSLHYIYANGLGKAEKYALSEKHFLKAIELEPDTAKNQANLAVLYHRWGKYAEAETVYKAAMALEPDNTVTQNHYAMLKRQMSKSKK